MSISHDEERSNNKTNKAKKVQETFAPVEGAVKGTEMHEGAAQSSSKTNYEKAVSQKILDTILGIDAFRSALTPDDLGKLTTMLDIVSEIYVEAMTTEGKSINSFLNKAPSNGFNDFTEIVKELMPVVESKKEQIVTVMDKMVFAKVFGIYLTMSIEKAVAEESLSPSKKVQETTVQDVSYKAVGPKDDRAILMAYFARYVAPGKKFKTADEESAAALEYVVNKIDNKRFILWAADFMDLLHDYDPKKHGNNFEEKKPKATAEDTWTDNIFTAIAKELPQTPGRIVQDMKHWFEGVRLFA